MKYMLLNAEYRPLKSDPNENDEEMVCVGCRARVNPTPTLTPVVLFPDSIDDLGRDYGLCPSCLVDLLSMINSR